VIVVTRAVPENSEAMAALLEEMDRFYGATEVDLGPLGLRIEQINDALFGEPPAASALLGWDDARLVGFAAYSFLWPAIGMTRSLYLKELYVAQDCRRRRVGERLMQALFEVAEVHQCSRVEWTTDDDNAAARRFYDALGHRRLPSKLFYRVQGQELRQAANHQSRLAEKLD